MTVVAEVVRSGFVECRHHGVVVALDAAGDLRLAVGDPDAAIFPRSCIKPLQAVGMLETGYAEKFDLGATHLALSAASHSSEAAHVARVLEILERSGVAESSLQCPPAWPIDEETATAHRRAGESPQRVWHNCSGKHAAMLAACAAAGWDVEDYLDAGHPLQQMLRAAVERLAGEPVTSVGVDGCGAPLFALSPRGLARGFSALVRAAPGSAECQVADAMRGHPDLVGGRERDVTALMRAVPGLVVKDGAEGCFAAATEDGTAFAVKIGDGAARARTPVLVAALRACGVTGDEAALDALAQPPVLGGGRRVGMVRAVLPA